MLPLWLVGRACFPGRGFFAVEPQREALGAAAGFDEFGQRRFVRRVAALPQVAMKLRTPRVGDDVASNNDRIASERLGLFGGDRDQRLDPLGQSATTVIVERAGIPDRLAGRERTEARVEVIVMLVNQLEG